ncbi:MAG: alpha/beta hydrolase, partial [Actinomycetota bacterium]
QTIALDYPERVSALLLGCTWARPIEFMRRQSALAELMIRSGDPTAVVDASLVRMFSPPFFEVGGEVIDRMVGAMFAEGGPEPGRPEVLLAQLGAVDKHDVLSRLGEIGVPTLVLGARMDMMVPYFAQEEIAAAIPGAELATFETGHGFTIEEMDAVNSRVSEFLGGLAG